MSLGKVEFLAMNKPVRGTEIDPVCFNFARKNIRIAFKLRMSFEGFRRVNNNNMPMHIG